MSCIVCIQKLSVLLSEELDGCGRALGLVDISAARVGVGLVWFGMPDE